MKKIKLTKGKFALVDDKDFDWLNQWKWYFNSGYAVRGCPERILMHRVILDTPEDMVSDHINRNKLDNRRSNLRNVTSSQNKVLIPMLSTNTSGYRGVHWAEKLKKWIARISVNNKSIYLGCFKKVEDAVKAYNDSVLIHHKIERNS